MQSHLPLNPRPLGARKRAASGAKISLDCKEVSHGYVKSFDGTKLFYSSEGCGKPLVFCYGLVCSSLHWTYQIDHFSEAYRAVWFDYRGHHNSERPKDLKSLTLENIAKDLAVVLDELGIQDAVLLGHSMGVNVVLEFYKRFPDRVAGMVLANGAPKNPLETLFNINAFQALFPALKKLHQKAPRLISMLWRSQKSNPLAKTLVTLGGFNPHLTPQADIELYLKQVIETDLAILLQMAESYEASNTLAWLHQVKVPTLIIAGEHDKVIPLEQQELMQQLIPGSQLEIIRHGSHCPQMDLPDLINLKIEKFLDGFNYVKESSPSTETANRSNEKLEFDNQIRVV